MIRVRQLQKAIGQTTVLAIESLEVSAGEVATIVGPTGSGKTTLLDILAGRVRPTAGSVCVAALDLPAGVARLGPLVGILFAENGLYERQSARANLDFQRRLHALPARRVDEVLEVLGILACADTAIGKLPHGLQRRVALGRALLHNPRVLLLDEPFVRVDAESAVVMARVIAERAEDGSAVLIASTEVIGLAHLCRRIYELDHGRIVHSYAPAEERQPGLQLKIPARQTDRVVLLNPADILYVRSDEGQTLLRTAEGDVPTRFTLAQLEERLRPSGFFRAHRAYLVNLQRVKEIVPYTRDSYTLVLDDGRGTELPLSKGSAQELQSLLGY